MKKPILASYVLLGLFLLFSALQWNVEFMIYAVVLVPIVFFLHKTDHLFSYRELALWGFVVWMALHIVGGLVSVGGSMMYDFMLIDLIGEPYSVLKYDQFVHFYCYVVIAMLLSSIVASVTKAKASTVTVFAIAALAATGVGALNEVIEFVPVVLFDSPGPGGYTNTAIDLIMNFLGSLCGSWLFLRKR